jgi:hypothetical protein
MVAAVFAAQPRVAASPRWFRTAIGMLGQTPANMSAQDVERLGRYLVFGVPDCASLAPADVAANQQVASRTVAYLTTVGATATDVQARSAAVRVAAAFSSFPCAYPGKQMPSMAAPPQPDDPPFALKSPDVGKVPDEQQETAADLLVRYDTDAARAAVIWKNAETLRLSLAQRGMSVNAQTAASVGRLKPLYDDAAAALKDHKWDDALSTLQAAEATTQKVAGAVGH